MRPMARRSVIAAAVLLLVYFVFTSGMVYELTGSEETNKLITPYSLSLSGWRTGLVGVYTEDDQKMAGWIATQSNQKVPTVCDGNTALLMRSYAYAQTIQLTTFEGSVSPDPHYLAYNVWNIETGKAITGAWTAGLREISPLPEPDMNLYAEVFRSGKAVVYERRQD